MVQEVADEIVRQMNINQRPPMGIEPLRQQVMYSNNQTQQQNTNQPQGYQPVPRVLKWCNIEKKYTNHETHECYFRPRYENQQAGKQQQQPQQTPAYRPQGYGRGQMDKPQPILGQQPPLPGTNQPVAVNFAQIEESPWE